MCDKRGRDILLHFRVSPEAYTEYITTADTDGNGAVNQSKAAETLRSILGLTAAQRTALW